MTSLLDKLKKASDNKYAALLGESKVLQRTDISTPIPALNIAFSGELNGGFSSGALTLLIGESRTFKSLTMLVCAKAYMDKFPDAPMVYFDSEMGSSMSYFESLGIDTSRVLHMPIANVEELKFQAVQILENITRGEHAILCVDSIGNLASLKECEDAIDQKSVADMSRAKALTSFCRIITPMLSIKDIPMIAVNHTMQTMSFIPQTVMKGGQGLLLSAEAVINLTRSMQKTGSEQTGWCFNMHVFKSRKSREKSKLGLVVDFNSGINKWSGLLEMACSSGNVVKPSQGWYSRVDSDGAVEEKKWRAAETNCAEFWEPVLKDAKFDEWVKKTFKVTHNKLISDGDPGEAPNPEFTTPEE